MKQIICLNYNEKPVTGGHKYNNAFMAHLEKLSGIKATVSYRNKTRGWKKIFSPLAELKCLKYFNKETLVIFGDTSFKHHFLLAIFNKWFKKAKSTIVVHHFPFLGQTGMLSKIDKWLMCKYVSYMDSIVVPSPFTLDVAKSLFPHKSIYYIPLPFEKKYIKSEKYEVGNLLYVGTIEERKGLLFLVEALSLLDNKTNINLNIIGKIVDQSYFEMLLRKINDLGLGHNIHFLGRVSDEELEKCYKKAEIFTFPSLLEGYGIVLIEAFNNGLPIICFDNTAMPYTVKDNVNGLIAKNKDAKDMASKIQQLTGNSQLREKLQKGIQETVMNLKTKDDFEKGIDFFYKQTILS